MIKIKKIMSLNNKKGYVAAVLLASGMASCGGSLGVNNMKSEEDSLEANSIKFEYENPSENNVLMPKYNNLTVIKARKSDMRKIIWGNETSYSLTKILLREQRITKCSSFSNQGFMNLEILDLSRNRIRSMDTLVSTQFFKLQELNLSENELYSITTLPYAKSLKTFSCNNNHIENIDQYLRFLPIDHPLLEYLDASNNKISVLDLALGQGHQDLKLEANLNCNPIEYIYTGVSRKYGMVLYFNTNSVEPNKREELNKSLKSILNGLEMEELTEK